jgi:PAS domain-containing protein
MRSTLYPVALADGGHQDIHAAKEALQERDARLRSILETAPDAII